MTPPPLTTLLLEMEGAVARVTLNRPEQANAMSAAMWPELQACFEWLDAEPGVRAVVLAGEGRHFCSGIDLGVFANLVSDHPDPARRAEQLRRQILAMQGNLTAIERCRKPVLAAIHGACIGGGVDLVTCCDMRYASDDAWFAVREIDIGMTADVGTLQRLPRLIPDGVARELAYTGRRMEADEARELGLVNRVFDTREALLEGATALAQEIARKSPLAIRGTKEMLLYTRDHPVGDGLNYIATWNAGMLSEEDLRLGIGAQASKTTAEYSD